MAEFHAFVGMQHSYAGGVPTKRIGGNYFLNITGMVWKSDGDDVRRKYDTTTAAQEEHRQRQEHYFKDIGV